MSQYRINLRTLRAIAKHIAPKSELRPYLIGVHVEFCTDGVYYIATDGAVLAAMRHEYDASETAPEREFSVIVPRDFALGIKFTKHRFEAVLDSEPWAIDGNPFRPVEGTFPQWRRILPKQDFATGESRAQYDGKRLAALEACCADIDGEDGAPGYFYQNGSKPAVFACYRVPQFLGVLMCRAVPQKAGPPMPPAWSGIEIPAGIDLV